MKALIGAGGFHLVRGIEVEAFACGSADDLGAAHPELLPEFIALVSEKDFTRAHSQMCGFSDCLCGSGFSPLLPFFDPPGGEFYRETAWGAPFAEEAGERIFCVPAEAL